MNNETSEISRVSEFQSKYNDEFMKPVFYKETWSKFVQDVAMDADLLKEFSYHGNKVMYFCRLSANGYMDCTDWQWDEDLEDLILTMEEMYPTYA